MFAVISNLAWGWRFAVADGEVTLLGLARVRNKEKGAGTMRTTKVWTCAVAAAGLLSAGAAGQTVWCDTFDTYDNAPAPGDGA